MTYAKIDDAFLDHPKALEAGEAAANLYLRALVWCSKHLTDGRIPTAALSAITASRRARIDAEALVRVRLWERRGDDAWQVHDYGSWNDDASSIRAYRDKKASQARERRRRARDGDTPLIAENVTGTSPATRNPSSPATLATRSESRARAPGRVSGSESESESESDYPQGPPDAATATEAVQKPPLPEQSRIGAERACDSATTLAVIAAVKAARRG